MNTVNDLINVLYAHDVYRIKLEIPLDIDLKINGLFYSVEWHEHRSFTISNYDCEIYVPIIERLIEFNIPFYLVIKSHSKSYDVTFKNNVIFNKDKKNTFKLSEIEITNIKQYNLMEIL